MDQYDIYVGVVHKKAARTYPDVAMPTHYVGAIRDESRLAYSVLARMLALYKGFAYNSKTIHKTPRGKPYHKDNQYYFSLSHSKDYVACVIGNKPVGIDIEQPRIVPPTVCAKTLTRSEQLDRVNPLQAWVVKEAYSKLLGLGLGLSFANITVAQIQQLCQIATYKTSQYICVVCCDSLDTKIIRV